jgi:hypothetical protein
LIVGFEVFFTDVETGYIKPGWTALAPGLSYHPIQATPAYRIVLVWTYLGSNLAKLALLPRE